VGNIGRRKIIILVNNRLLCKFDNYASVISIFYLIFLGKHLSSLGIRPSDTRDQYLRGTFHGYSLQNLLWGVAKPDSYFTRAVYPIRGECCSPISVTFSASEPDKMHTLNYLLYQLRILNGESRFGNVPANVPVQEEDVSFNII